VELQRLPKSLAGFLLTFCTNQEIERFAMAVEQTCGEIAPEISG